MEENIIMKVIASILIAVAFAGCRTTFPEINGTYLEDKTATVAYARDHGLTTPEWIETYSTGLCQTVVINGNMLSKRCQDTAFDHRVRFNRIDPSTFRFRYPYDLESDVFIILADDGIWLTVPGKPEHRFKFKKQK
jgi:hypothetical protein